MPLVRDAASLAASLNQPQEAEEATPDFTGIMDAATLAAASQDYSSPEDQAALEQVGAERGAEFKRVTSPGGLTQAGRGFDKGTATLVQGFHGLRAFYNQSGLLGSPDMADFASAMSNLEEVQALQEKRGPAIQTISQINDFGDATNFLLGGIPQLIPFATGVGGATAVGGVIGAKLATKGLVKELVQTQVEKQVGKKFRKKAAQQAGTPEMAKQATKLADRSMQRALRKSGEVGQITGQIAGAMIANTGLETGFIFADMTQEGGLDAASAGPALAYGSVSGLLGAAGSVYLLRKIFGKNGILLRKPGQVNKAKKKVRKIMETARTTGIESSTEVMQEAMNIAAVRDVTGRTGPLTASEMDQLLTAGVLAAAGTAVLTSTAQAVSSAPNAAQALRERQERMQARADAKRTATETEEMFSAQVDAVNEGRKPAMFVPVGDGAEWVARALDEVEGSVAYEAEDGSGVFIFNDPNIEPAVIAGLTGTALGYGVEEKSGDGSFVVTARDAKGRVIHDVAVDQNDHEAVANAMEAAKLAAGTDGSVETRTAAEAIADRAKGAVAPAKRAVAPAKSPELLELIKEETEVTKEIGQLGEDTWQLLVKMREETVATIDKELGPTDPEAPRFVTNEQGNAVPTPERVARQNRYRTLMDGHPLREEYTALQNRRDELQHKILPKLVQKRRLMAEEEEAKIAEAKAKAKVLAKAEDRKYGGFSVKNLIRVLTDLNENTSVEGDITDVSGLVPPRVLKALAGLQKMFKLKPTLIVTPDNFGELMDRGIWEINEEFGGLASAIMMSFMSPLQIFSGARLPSKFKTSKIKINIIVIGDPTVISTSEDSALLALGHEMGHAVFDDHVSRYKGTTEYEVLKKEWEEARAALAAAYEADSTASKEQAEADLEHYSEFDEYIADQVGYHMVKMADELAEIDNMSTDITTWDKHFTELIGRKIETASPTEAMLLRIAESLIKFSKRVTDGVGDLTDFIHARSLGGKMSPDSPAYALLAHTIVTDISNPRGSRALMNWATDKVFGFRGKGVTATVLPPGPDEFEPVLQGAQGSTRNVPESASMPPREPSSMDPGEALREKIRLQREGQEDETPEFGAYSVKDGVGLKNRDKPFKNAPSFSQDDKDWTRIEHFAWNDPDLAEQYPIADYGREFVEGPDGWTVKVEFREGRGLSTEAMEARTAEQRMGTGPEQTGITTESQIRQKIIHTQKVALKRTDAENKSGSKRDPDMGHPNPEHVKVAGISGRPLYLHLPAIVTLGHMISRSNPNRSGVRSGKDAQKTLDAYSTGLAEVYETIAPYLADPAEFWAKTDPSAKLTAHKAREKGPVQPANQFIGYKVLAKRGREQGYRPVTLYELQRDSSKALKKALDRERSIRDSEQKIEDDIARIQEKDGLTHADAKAKANKELVAENREGAQSAKELGPVSAPAKDKIGLNVAREGRIEFLEKRIKLEREGRALPDEANLKKDRIAAWQAELDMLNDLAAEENLSSHTNLVNSVAMSEAGSAAEISEIYRQLEELKRVPVEDDQDTEQIDMLEQKLMDMGGIPAALDAAQVLQRELDMTRIDQPERKALQYRVKEEVSKAKRNAAESALFGFPEGGIESVDQIVERAEATSLPKVDPETRKTVQKPTLKTTRSSDGVTTIMAGPWNNKLTGLVRNLRKLLGIPEEIVIMDRVAFEQVYGKQDNETYNGSGGMTILPQRKGEPVIIVMHNEMVNRNLVSGLMAIGHEMGHVAYEAYIKGMPKAVRARLESEWRADLKRTETLEADHSFEEWMSDQMSHWVNKFLTDEAWMKSNKIAAVKQNVRARAYKGIPGFFRGFIKQLLEISDAVRSYAGGIIAARTTRSDAYADFMQQIMASVAAREAAVKVFAEQGGLESAQVNDPAYGNLIKGLREAARAEAKKVFQAKANSGGMLLPSPILARPGADPKYMNLGAARRGAEALTVSVQNGEMADGIAKWLDTAMRNASLFLRGADKVLRDLPGGDRVADHFNVQAGKVASAAQKAMGNYWDESRLEMARWMGKVDAIFLDGPAGFNLLESLPITSRTARRGVKKAIQERQAEAARDMLQDGGPTTTDGKALRAVLNEFQADTRAQQLQHRAPVQYRTGQYTDDHRPTDASVVGYIENFFPHMWSPSVLDTAQGRVDFDRLMDQYVQPDYVGQEWQAFKDEIFRGLVDGEGFDMATGTDAGGVSSLQWSGGKQRTLNIPTTELIDAGLIMFDKGEFGIEGVLESYFKQATRALQWEKRFGGYVRFDPETAPPPGVRQHDRIGKLDIERNRDRARQNRAPGEDIFFWDPSKKLNDYITTLPSEDARIRARTILNAYAGRLGNDLSPGMKVAAEAFMMITNIIILPLAVFAQFADIGVMYQRSGDLRATLKAVMDSAQEWGKDNQGEMGRYAKQAGIIVDRELQNIMIETSEMGGRSRGARWLNNTRKAHNTFFHLNGMEGFTSMMRRAAASLGSEYMVNHAQIVMDPNSTEKQKGASAERLAELGVDPMAVVLWDLGGRTTEDRGIMRGLNVFVDEAAMRPTAARRPALISHPVIGMLQHLHQFMYVYNTQVLDRFKNMYVYGSSEAPMESFKAVSRLIPSAVGLAMLGYMMRTMLYGLGDDDDKDRSLSFMDAVDKAGLLGTWQLGYDWVRNDYNKGFLDNSLYTLMGGGPSLFTKFITSSPESAVAGFVPNIPGGRGFKKSVKEAIGG